jgi:hypothetical protein
MADLLLQPSSNPSAHLKSILHSKPSRRDSKSLAIRHAKSSPQLRDGGILSGPISRTLRSANDIWLSWNDGLTADERERRRLLEEEKELLRFRMKTVCSHIIVLSETILPE